MKNTLGRRFYLSRRPNEGPAHHSSKRRREVVPISHIVFTDFWAAKGSHRENRPSYSSTRWDRLSLSRLAVKRPIR